MPEQVDCVVVGAGVVGLAVARALALAGREVIILEAADAIGTETSSRNSEVIHAGIYYPKGSLKARSCAARRRYGATPGRHGSEPNGSSRGTPRRSKSRTLRVTSVRP